MSSPRASSAVLVFSALLALGAFAMTATTGHAEILFAKVLPPPDPNNGLKPEAYRIGPLDELQLLVYQDKDLTTVLDVDASGRVDVPIAGPLVAAGKTPSELAGEIAEKLGENYLRDPQVAVVVTKPQSQKITVEGEVAKPGVYDIFGRTTLIRAVALASGADQYADYAHVAVFRSSGGRTFAAMYNLDRVNQGKDPDPEVFNNDVVVVERSSTKAFVRDYLAPISPLIYVLPTIIPKL